MLKIHITAKPKTKIDKILISMGFKKRNKTLLIGGYSLRVLGEISEIVLTMPLDKLKDYSVLESHRLQVINILALATRNRSRKGVVQLSKFIDKNVSDKKIFASYLYVMDEHNKFNNRILDSFFMMKEVLAKNWEILKNSSKNI